MSEYQIPPMRHTCRDGERCLGCVRDNAVDAAEEANREAERAAQVLATARRVSSIYQRRGKALAAVLLDARGLVRGMDPALDERIHSALTGAGFLSSEDQQ